MATKKIYHLNDRTLKYKAMAQSERLHQYLELPGEYEAMYPQEIVFPNMDSGRVDDYHSTKEGLLINLEEETGDVSEETLEKYGRYAIFGEFIYSKNYYLAVLCHKDPSGFPQWYERSPSVYIKIHYYHFTQKELWERYEKVIRKVEQKEELSEIEALDIAFIPKFISRKNAPFVTESLSKTFKDAKINDKVLRRDVGVLLGAMIVKNVDGTKQTELMEVIDMKQIDNKIKKLAEDEFGDKIRKAERKNLKLQQENTNIKQENTSIKQEQIKLQQELQEFKEGIGKLNKIPDLNPEAKKIINSLIVLR